MTERAYPGYLPSSGWDSGYEVHDCYYQALDNGFVRFTLDMTTPRGCFVSILPIGSGSEEALDQYLSLPGKQQYVFDIPAKTLAECRNLSVLVAKPNTRGRYFEIPCGAFAVCDAVPIADPFDLAWEITAQPAGLDCELLSATVQPLDNGFLRYELKLRANEQIRAILSDVPNAENFSLLFLYLSEPLDGVHTFTFDMDSAAAAQVPEIRFEGSFPENRILSSAVANVLPDICAEPVHVDILRCD